MNLLDAIRSQHARQRAVYGHVPSDGSEARHCRPRVPAAMRRLNQRLWTPVDWRWWRKLSSAQQRGYAFGAMSAKRGEIGQSLRAQEAEVQIRNLTAVGHAFDRRRERAALDWIDSRIARRKRMHRPTADLKRLRNDTIVIWCDEWD